MYIIKRLRTFAAAVAGLGITLAALAGTASASTGLLQPPVQAARHSRRRSSTRSS